MTIIHNVTLYFLPKSKTKKISELKTIDLFYFHFILHLHLHLHLHLFLDLELKN